MRTSSGLPLLALVLAGCALAGCALAHTRGGDAGPVADGGCDLAARPVCTRRAGPCEPLELVDAGCDGAVWACPPGSRPYERPWAEETTCLPLRGEPLFADGVHESPVPIPIDDTCTWVFPAEGDGRVQLLGAAVGARCDALGAPVFPLDDVHERDRYVNVQGFFTTAAGVRPLARRWAIDPTAPFGVRTLGVELGRVVDGHLSFPGEIVFDDFADPGDAALVQGGFAYTYGCPGPAHDFEEDCVVGRAPIDRIDDPTAWTMWGQRGWGIGLAAPVFGSGPHRSAVVSDPRDPSRLLHLYAAGFGRELRLATAPAPEGPWTRAVTFAPCELPADDPGAYCAGPQIHRELLDPLDPHRLIVSYSIGSTSEDQAERRARDPDAYWPRVVILRLP
ncbi:MAG: hypothetical protein U0234_09975 [Sandaracinus sp.]